MASPNSTFTQILSTSLYNRTSEISNNIAKRNALYRYIYKKKNLKKIAGGVSIVRPIEYAENNTYTRYTAAQSIDITPQTILTSCEYPWRQIAMTVQSNGLEEIQNAGKEQIIDLLATKQRNCETSFVNNHSTDLYSDGTASGGLQVGGLQHLVADAPTATATVGGIAQQTYSWWQNISKTATTATGFGARVSASNVRLYFENMYLAGLRDGQNFDLILSDNSIWQFYTSALRAIQQIGTSESVSDGILTLKVYGAEYMYDGGADGACPSARAYFLNTDFIYMCVSSKRNLTKLPGNRQPINQDVSIEILAWAGNMVCSNRRAQAVLIDA